MQLFVEESNHELDISDRSTKAFQTELLKISSREISFILLRSGVYFLNTLATSLLTTQPPTSCRCRHPQLLEQRVDEKHAFWPDMLTWFDLFVNTLLEGTVKCEFAINRVSDGKYLNLVHSSEEIGIVLRVKFPPVIWTFFCCYSPWLESVYNTNLLTELPPLLSSPRDPQSENILFSSIKSILRLASSYKTVRRDLKTLINSFYGRAYWLADPIRIVNRPVL